MNSINKIKKNKDKNLLPDRQSFLLGIPGEGKSFIVADEPDLYKKYLAYKKKHENQSNKRGPLWTSFAKEG